jgi:Xaa-Pro dipeptidase
MGDPLRRRELLQGAGALAAGALLPSSGRGAGDVPAAIAQLQPATSGMQPIGADEHRARRDRSRPLMAEGGLDALVLTAGSNLAYFTGVEWHVSERFFGALVPREGDPVWIAPAFERDRAAERIPPASGELLTWEEHESPYLLLAGALRDRGLATGALGVDEAMPYAFVDGIGRALPAARLRPAAGVTGACRMVKDAHEVALMRRACEITLRAHQATLASLREGMTQEDAGALVREAHRRQGVSGDALVLFGPDAAFPHGTAHPRRLRAGDVVLVDGGGSLFGYQSDITRTIVWGAKPTAEQRRTWLAVQKAQQAALHSAHAGTTGEALDAVARESLAADGLGTGYSALTHRLGHGIGLDEHEPPYLVRGNAVPLAAGTTVTIEPGVYVRGALGIRLEDVVVIGPDGAESLTRLATSPETP